MRKIIEIIENTRKYLGEYWKKTLLQRLPDGAGSRFLNINSIEELENLLKNLKWEKYNHPAIQKPARGWKAFLPSDVKAVIGVVRLSNLPEDTPVTLDDRKNTGKVSAVTKMSLKDMPQTDFVTLITGPHPEKAEVEVVWTVHPGSPVRPSQVEADPSLVNKTITVKEALALGLKWAKIEENRHEDNK